MLLLLLLILLLLTTISIITISHPLGLLLDFYKFYSTSKIWKLTIKLIFGNNNLLLSLLLLLALLLCAILNCRGKKWAYHLVDLLGSAVQWIPANDKSIIKNEKKMFSLEQHSTISIYCCLTRTKQFKFIGNIHKSERKKIITY